MSVATLEKRADRAKREPESMPDLPEFLHRNAENVSTPGAASETVVAVIDVETMISAALGTSVLEIEQLIAHLEKARDRLQEEAQRVQQEVSRYAQMHHEVRNIIKIMAESLSELINRSSR